MRLNYFKKFLTILVSPILIVSCIVPDMSEVSIANGYEKPCPKLFFDNTWENVVDSNEEYPDMDVKLMFDKPNRSHLLSYIEDKKEMKYPFICKCTDIGGETFAEISISGEGKTLYAAGKFKVIDKSTLETWAINHNALASRGSIISTGEARAYIQKWGADSLKNHIIFRRK